METLVTLRAPRSHRSHTLFTEQRGPDFRGWVWFAGVKLLLVSEGHLRNKPSCGAPQSQTRSRRTRPVIAWSNSKRNTLLCIL